MNSYYQVVGSGPWTIDYPHGDTKAHLPGDVFEARPENASVERGLRMGRLRMMDPREVAALRATKTAKAVTPTPGPITPAPKPASKTAPAPKPGQ